MTLRVGIDIGGVLTRYPYAVRSLARILYGGGAQLFMVTDMNPADATAALAANAPELLETATLVCCDWTAHGDLCKVVEAERLGLDLLIDDRPDYCAIGEFIGLVVAPRPAKPYYHSSWQHPAKSPTRVVDDAEYQQFLAWRKRKVTCEDRA